jgi:glyoxylase-like metal-dependent hydrolase (beta-lactamase superfamily II)
MHIDIFNVPAKPIPSQVPAFSEAMGQATWPPSTATLISGDTESLLVDALMTTAEGRELAAWVSWHQRALRAVYITHPHADHLFGLGPVLREHPAARPVTLSGMVPGMREQASDAWVQIWKGFFPGQIEAPGALPEPLDGDSLTIDGTAIRFVATGQTDTELSSVVYVPDNATVVAGDVAYNGVHMWMYQSTPDSRSSWLRALDIVESLGPSTVIAGHRDPGARDDDAHRVLDESRTYIHDFEAALASSTSPQELINIMMSKHGHLANPYTLWLAAFDQFAGQS